MKGWNWGVANFNGSVLNFEVGKHDAFEVPLTYVNHCQAQKNEVRTVIKRQRTLQLTLCYFGEGAMLFL